MATNHLGHFALTGLLLDRIVTTARSRIVTVSSHLHRMGRLRQDDVAGAAFHSTWVAYGTSKLANLLFTAELSRRLQAAGLPDAGPGGPSGLDAKQSGRERRCPRQQPSAPEARAGGRVHARAIRGGRCPSRPVRRHLVVGRPGPVHRSGSPVRALRPAQGGAPVTAGPGSRRQRPPSGRRPRNSLRCATRWTPRSELLLDQAPCAQEVGVSGDPVGTQHAPEGADHRASAGPLQRGAALCARAPLT